MWASVRVPAGPLPIWGVNHRMKIFLSVAPSVCKIYFSNENKLIRKKKEMRYFCDVDYIQESSVWGET